MRKLYLGLGILYAFYFLTSVLFDDAETDKFFTIEMDIWTVRTIWAGISVFMFVIFYFDKGSKKEQK